MHGLLNVRYILQLKHEKSTMFRIFKDQLHGKNTSKKYVQNVNYN